MKLELYKVPEDKNGELIKDFLLKNNLKFTEMQTDNLQLLGSIVQYKLSEKISILRIKSSHSIHVHLGFNEPSLNQLVEHINKYKPKLE